MTDKIRMTCCDNCDKTVPEDQLAKSLYEIDSLEDRLDPGSEVPAGECQCGALAYIVRENPRVHDRLDRIRARVEADDFEAARREARQLNIDLSPRTVDVI